MKAKLQKPTDFFWKFCRIIVLLLSQSMDIFYALSKKKAGIPALNFSGYLKDEHGIAIGEKAVFLCHGFFVGAH